MRKALIIGLIIGGIGLVHDIGDLVAFGNMTESQVDETAQVGL